MTRKGPGVRIPHSPFYVVLNPATILDMPNSYQLNFNEALENELIFDFHNTQIWRFNTSNSDAFLKAGYEFDAGILKRLDEFGRCRVLYIGDKVPPLTAILKHLENPFPIKWGVFAIIAPLDIIGTNKVNPVIRWAIGLTQYRKNYVLGVFDHSQKKDLTRVMHWMDENMEISSNVEPVTFFTKELKH